MGRLAKVGRAKMLKAQEGLTTLLGTKDKNHRLILLCFLPKKSHPKKPESASFTFAIRRHGTGMTDMADAKNQGLELGVIRRLVRCVRSPSTKMSASRSTLVCQPGWSCV